MELVVIDGTDFTSNITVPSYKVNKEEVYEEWTDANYTKHREITRYKISGSFKLYFETVADQNAFFDTVETMKASSNDGSITANLYLNNLHTVQTGVHVFIKYTPSNENPHINGAGKISGFEVTIEER